MADQDLQALEAFVLSPDKREALKQFPSTSSLKSYIEGLLLLSSDPSDDDLDLILQKLSSTSNFSNRLKLRRWLKLYEKTQDKEILSKINSEFFGYNFEYAAPRNIQHSEAEHFPSVFTPLFPDLTGAALNEKTFNTLTANGKLKIDILQTSDSVFKKLLSTGQLWKYEGFSQRFLKFYEKNPNFQETECFKRLSKQQLSEISTAFPEIWKNTHFLRNWLKKEYFSESYSMTNSEKYEYMKFISSKILHNPNYPEYLSTIILLNILLLETILGKCEEFWFFLYLQYHRSHALYKDNKPASKVELNEFILKTDTTENALLTRYLTILFFRNPELITKLSPMIEDDFLIKLHAVALIERGEPLENIDKKLIPDDALTSVKLEPCFDNAKEFTRNEPVKFYMQIKNIPRLLVKVLEINAKNYYLSTFQQINTNIKLDGLIAKSEYTYEFEEPAQKCVIKDFEFPELADKVGIFVIEFFGNSRQNRVIVKKGSLRFLSHITPSGQAVYVMNEDNEICKASAGIYLDSRFYPADDQGRIDIPFARTTSHKSIVLTDGVAYELDNSFQHLSETYELRTAFLINPEQLVAGCSINILIKPRLYINGLHVSGSLLHKGKAVLSTKDSENTTSSKTFQDLEIPSDSGAIELSFEVPPQLIQVDIEFSGEIENTDGVKLPLTSSYTCTTNQILLTSRTSSLFLNTRDDEYILEARGRNGEPISHQTLKISASHIGWNDKYEQTLETDDNGIVQLGSLDSISTISVIGNKEGGGTEMYSWNMLMMKGAIEYPSKIRLCKGDEFVLPVFLRGAYNVNDLVWFYSIQGDLVVNNKVDDLSLDIENSTLKFNLVNSGTFILVFKDTLTEIEFVVYDGVHLGKVILQDNKAVYTSKDYMSIGISSIQKQESELKVKVSGHSDDNSKVFAFYFRYLSTEVFAAMLELSKLVERVGLPDKEFTRPENIFIPSTALDEEYQYVLDRKKHARFTGRTLNKPQLLLKRLFLQDTKTEIQAPKPGGDYWYRSMAADKNLSKAMSMSRGMASPRRQLSVGLNVPFDFLQNPATYITTDITNGFATLPILPNYSNVLIIAYNSIGSAYKLHPLPAQIHTKELRSQSSAVDSTEVYKSAAINPGETFTLNDFANTSLEIIDSFSKLFKMLVEISTLNGNSCGLKDWEFLIEWPRFSIEKKREFYEKFLSHEFNIFLYKRDPEFFAEVVKPFIVCKMKKDIVDKYLCGDSVVEFAAIDKIHRINSLEKALVVDQVRGEDVGLAERICGMMKSMAGVQEIDPKVRNNRIQAVLRFNAVAGEEKFLLTGFGEKQMEGDLLGYANLNQFQYEDCEIDDSYDEVPQIRTFGIEKKSMARGGADDIFAMESATALMPMEPRSEMRRVSIPKYYKKLEETKEFCETYYYNQVPGTTHPSLSPKFFAELSESFISSTPWLSESMIHCTYSLTELLAILAYANIPFKPEKHSYSSSNNQWHLKASSPLMTFYKEIGKAPLEINPLIFIANKYYNLDETEAKQFIKEKLYKCRVTITNTSGMNLDFTVLTQIPEGSIALLPCASSKTHFKSIPNYTTNSVEFIFYFPYSGEFRHHAGNIAVNGTVVAKTAENLIKVLDTYDTTQLETFKDLVISGRKDLILEFLKTKNIVGKEKNFEIKELFWMFKNKEFWLEVVEIYRQRFVFDELLWGFAFVHNEKAAVAELVGASEAVREAVGCYFKSGLLETDGEKFKHIEFDPIVNARAYKLGSQERITNQRFKEVYKQYLIYLVEKGFLEDNDMMCLCQYFIYQERYKEAMDIYHMIPMKPSSGRIQANYLQIQYDYLTCYLDLEKAKDIAKLYGDYSVPVWNKHFKDVVELLKELGTQDVVQVSDEKKEPSLNFKVENNTIEIVYENVEQCLIRVYEIDLEILFSKNPFLIRDTQSFSYVKANHQFEVELTENPQKVSLSEFKGKNVLVEVDYKTYSCSKSYFSNMLKINCIERFGVIKVMDCDRKPRQAVYVKAFVKRKPGVIEFYKDGYTDVRGKFDYVSLNTDSLSTIERFALLVVDDELGSLVHEASPPPQ